MSKIVVTGAAGFIGSHLAERLVENGHEVKAFVHYNSTGSIGWLEQSAVASEMEILRGDVRDYDLVHSTMQGCTEVYHLAALIGIPHSYVSPLAYIRTNVEGTYNVLESARALDLESVIVTSTSETYGSAQFVPVTEMHPQVGQSPYSASKIAGDQLATSYHRSFDLPVKIVRPFNTYGPRQSARAIIPTIISQVLSGSRELRLGNLTPRRDLTYVQDTVEGFIAIADSPALIGEVTNIGSNSETSVKEILDQITALCETEVAIVIDEERVRPSKSEVGRLWCDNSKLLRHTKWSPHYSLEHGLRETICWMRDHLESYKAEIYNK